MSNDSCVLPVGRFLRKTKINELPQIINILLTDMSIVGPRPLMQKQFRFYDEAAQRKNCFIASRPYWCRVAYIPG